MIYTAGLSTIITSMVILSVIEELAKACSIVVCVGNGGFSCTKRNEEKKVLNNEQVCWLHPHYFPRNPSP